MSYAALSDIQKVLGTEFTTYPVSITDQQEFAEGIIDGVLAGSYTLRFDDTGIYTSVPVQIKWVAALLVAWRLWDKATVIEGQADDTAAGKWKEEAYDWLEKIKNGMMRLTLDDGTLVAISENTLPRSFPDGVRDKAKSADNKPMFTRAQAGKW